MFKRKCNRCGEEVNKKHNYCPGCGHLIQEKTQDLGMLGKSDFNDLQSFNQIKFPRGFNMLFNSLMKNLDRQFREFDREMGKEKIQIDKFPKIKKGGISISISTSPGKEPEIKMRSFGLPQFKKQEEKIKKQFKEIPAKKLPQKKLKIAKLPKEEPPTHIRRLADKIIYEIDMPGVKSVKDISIVQLENSIEIKALAKDKAYIKLIPINLPILNYNLEKGKLVLELEARG